MVVESARVVLAVRVLMGVGFWEVVDVPRRNTLHEVGGGLASLSPKWSVYWVSLAVNHKLKCWQ